MEIEVEGHLENLISWALRIQNNASYAPLEQVFEQIGELKEKLQMLQGYARQLEDIHNWTHFIYSDRRIAKISNNQPAR